jgi:hypothetical protein
MNLSQGGDALASSGKGGASGRGDPAEGEGANVVTALMNEDVFAVATYYVIRQQFEKEIYHDEG